MTVTAASTARSGRPESERSVPFLDAARGRPAAHTPVWFMRQAGRSLPEYRAMRGEGSILEAIKRPELAAEITLQPVRRYGVDAAVLFSDIVVPAHAVGFGIDVTPGTGPVATAPLRDRADLDRLPELEPEAHTPYVLATIDALVDELPADVPLLAFAGAPFTVASYLIEGRPSRTYEHTKRMMHTDAALWAATMLRLVQHAVASISAQLDHGARAFQLFDSWAGALSRVDYETFVLPYSAAVFAGVAARHPQAPGVHFGIGCDHLLGAMLDAGPSVLGLDWRTPIADARRRLDPDLVVQGNLDPALVLAGREVALAGTRAVLADNGGHPGHIFNLGHGVQPNTDPDVLAAVVDLVHEPPMTDRPMTGPVTGVVVMAYGTPRSPAEILPYYTDIRRGRAPTDEQLADLTRRYAAIGGTSPLAARTEAQRAAIAAALGDGYRVVLGLKHADPKIEAAVDELAAEGVERVLGLVLAPHFSAFSVGEYLGRMTATADGHGMTSDGVRSWATEPAFVELVAADVRTRLAALPAGTFTLFTAHSLPRRIVDAGDPYPDELRATAAAVAERVGLADDAWGTAWQSAGRTPEPWLGPDVLEAIDGLAADGRPGVLVSAVGFVADHLEVLYDLDIEASQRAAAAGIAFARTVCVNDEPTVMAALARRIADLG